MAYHKKLAFTRVVDSLYILAALLLSSLLLYEFTFITSFLFLVTVVIMQINFYFFSFIYRLYKKSWEYVSLGELVVILKTVGLTIIMTAILQQLIVQVITFRILIITLFFQVVFIGGSRLSKRIARRQIATTKENNKRTLIIGAGSAGTMVARQLQENRHSGLDPIVFVDDDVTKHHFEIYSIPVVGSTKDINKVVKEHQIENIVIAIPSLNKRRLNEIFQGCVNTKLKTHIMPMIEDLITGKLSVNQIREVKVEDLLGRKPTELDLESIEKSVSEKVVLVTGAGGSIGSEICRQVSKFTPKKLILLGHGESSIHSIEMELLDLYQDSTMEIVTEIADIQDAKKISTIMNYHNPDLVYHAAAHKHVPLMERNPEEAVKNNVIGTMIVAKASISSGVGTFVMISSDKAVNPTSVMGASKRLAEIVVQSVDKESNTKFSIVRFGNVLGSRGSVIPLFKKQIQKGGPVTVTHPDMMRYFMTIPEASRLVIQSGSLAKGGEIFVLDMGNPVKIVDLAKNLIKLSGQTLEEIGITYTGIRKGEKLYEELLNHNEVHSKQVHPKIYVEKPSNVLISEIEEFVLMYSQYDVSILRKKLLELANRRYTEIEPSMKEKAVI